MRQYIFRRALLIVPTILGVSLLISGLLQLLPGNAADIILAESGGFSANLTKEKIEADLGLDKELFGLSELGFLPQWWGWMGGVVQGDFGDYFRGGKPVGHELEVRAPVTLQLAGMALVLSLLIAIPIGVLSAIRQDTPIDYIFRSGAIFMLAVPGFWLGVMFFVLVGRWADWMLPPLIYQDPWENLGGNLKQMWAPATILAFALAGGVMRLTRGQMLEVLRQDYIRTAWAKGLRERTVIMRHAVKNAFIPVLSLIGVQIPILISGSVVLESIFGLPGVGRMLLDGLFQREYLAVLAINLLIASLIVVTNFVVDVAYSFLDPRIRYA
ncbi:MAG: ABC transporter permease [Chloroflexi bacterium]|nr:ABC transporter permease [Chloroflexota bacterium]